MKQLLTKLVKDQSGQDLIEYALIALVVNAALTSVGTKVRGVLGNVAASL